MSSLALTTRQGASATAAQSSLHQLTALALQVVLIVDAFFFDKVAANDGIHVLALGSAEAYAAALADPEARWRKPVTLVHAWMSRLKEHYEVRLQHVHRSQQSAHIVRSSWRAYSPRRPKKRCS